MSYYYPVFAQDQTIQFEHLSVKDGLSQLSVLSIFQDSQGFMWFGTRNGLNRYDGYNFEIFRESDAGKYISNGHVECMAEDSQKRLWIGTRRGLNRYDGKTKKFIQYFHSDNDSTISDNNVICLFKDYRGNFWVGTTLGLDRYLPETDNFERCSLTGLPSGTVIYSLTEDHDENLWIGTGNGLYVYNPRIGKMQVYRHYPDDLKSIAQERISALFCDSKGRMWIGCYQQGVCLYDSRNDNFIRLKKEEGLSSNTVRCIEEDKEGNIIAGTYDGLSRYDELNRKFVSTYSSTENDITSMSNFSVYAVLCDRAGTVWIGTYSGGVSYYSPYNQRFRFHNPGMHGRMLFGIIGPIVEHSTGIWMGTEGGGLLFYDRNTGSYRYYRLPATSERSFSQNIIKSLLLEDDILWVGTAHNTIYRFDIRHRLFGQPVSPEWGTIQYALFRDSRKNFWIGASGTNALGYIRPDGRSVHPLPLNNDEIFNPTNIRCIQEGDADMYFGSTNTGLYRYNDLTKTVTLFSHHENDSCSLAYNGISSLCKTKNGSIWVSTLGGGISCLNPVAWKFENYSERSGLSSGMVYSLVEDHDGKLWLSTFAGISKFDPDTRQFSNYDKNNGIGIAEFTPGSGFVTSDNEVFFGGNNGFVSFYPRKIKENNYVPPVFITKISINNQELDNQNVMNEKSLQLNYKQSNISVEFSALNYIFPHQNLYAYKLEGFDKKWNYVKTRRVAYYTNIQPGKYTFLVKGSNNDGVWNDQCATFRIDISSPPWDTVWAWMLYISVFITGLFLIVRYTRIKNRLETNIRIEQLEKKNIEELHQTKINLFTNFSHELRTPLTLILSPLEDILQNNGLNPALRDTLKLMHQNAGRLLYTVNQLMDFRRKETGHLKLRAAEGNIVKFTHEIFIAFCELARKRQIDFRFDCNEEELLIWYDRDLLEKVLFNLLSNAFKNTPDGGGITITLLPWTQGDLKQTFGNKIVSLPDGLYDFILIEVKDTGQGIPEDELEKIFDPFYQVYQKETSQLQTFGTGIGLNLSKGIIDLHHGLIWATNTFNAGATFHIVLPFGRNHLENNELNPYFKNSEDPSHYMIIQENEIASPEFSPKQNDPCSHSILIVEDNVDVRYYIKSYLAKQYTIYEAGNGQEAFEIAVEQLPDLIVSDIMMPVMDGIHLCRMLKDDLRTGHIPVILLTARITVIQVQEGFENGADDYITKPFNPGLLATRIRNLIVSPARLKNLFGQETSFLFPGLPTSQVDSRFMDSVYDYINQHLTNPDLSMDNFCREIGMSRSNFYRKIKTLSNLNPNELIRNTRLQFAARYIRETDKSISEIAYDAGFSSPSYFTKTFREYFNISPTEMRKN
jgi:signal transduction histidine kinase/ligand-binding sensor domain-containing protein/DNA-binding response OmpR family regulator